MKIHFVGVWDTVSELGFPENWASYFNPLFKVMDLLADQVWPHTHYNYNITPATEYGYHALAIDDARKTFRPRVWREGERSPASVQQVWFAGAHSNVGGGYPRSGMSDVALDWMMQKAADHGLKFNQGAHESVKESANIQGKLYDSRDGFGVYYRYQPRYIDELCQNKLNSRVQVHHTVFERIYRGTARYSPCFLPQKFSLVGTNASYQEKNINLPEQEWLACQDQVKHWVKKRQLVYRLFIDISFFLVLVSLFLWIYPADYLPQYFNDYGGVNESCSPGWLADFLMYITPAMFEMFIALIICKYLEIFYIMLAVLISLYYFRKRYVKKLTQAKEACRSIVVKQAS